MSRSIAKLARLVVGITAVTTAWFVVDVPATTAADIDLLEVAEFDTVAAAPSRTAFWGSEGWADTDGNGCDSKNDAMTAQSFVPVGRDGRCKVTTGRWLSYDGTYATERTQIEGDHLVPLENAAGHGAGAWDAATRRRFYNDPIEIRITSAASNAAKSDSGPERWRPSDAGQHCSYATQWVAVKRTWALSVSAAEKQALIEMLATCPASPSSPLPSPSPSSPSAGETCASQSWRVPEWFLSFAVEDPTGCTARTLPDDRWLLVEFMTNDATWAQRCVARDRRPENIGNVFMVCWPSALELTTARQRQATFGGSP